jgi:hypothetical protein
MTTGPPRPPRSAGRATSLLRRRAGDLGLVHVSQAQGQDNPGLRRRPDGGGDRDLAIGVQP